MKIRSFGKTVIIGTGVTRGVTGTSRTRTIAWPSRESAQLRASKIYESVYREAQLVTIIPILGDLAVVLIIAIGAIGANLSIILNTLVLLIVVVCVRFR